MIGPAGTFAGPQASDYKPWQVRTNLKNGDLYERQRFATEEEAREIALATSGVKGQRSWVIQVLGPEGHVATYRGGRELKRRAAT